MRGEEGPFGVDNLNRLSEEILEAAGLIDPSTLWYAGRPVMVMENDYRTGLFNGDIGLVLPDLEANGALRVFFPAEGGGFVAFHPARLPRTVTVFAMTVHKSQGSEFEDVLVVTPDRDTPVMTRETLYTAVTRAKKRLTMAGHPEPVRRAAAATTWRESGLSERLWS